MQRIRLTRTNALYSIIAVLLGLLAALLATGFSTSAAAEAAVHPVAMMTILGTACVPAIRWAVRGDRWLVRVVAGGMAAKVLGTYLRFTLTGDGDNVAYHRAGTQVAAWLQESITVPSGLPGRFGGNSGTNWMSYFVGWTYYVTGANRVTAFVVFSFIGFLGMLCFYRAAITSIPQLDQRRYAVLLFYMPAMVFWPSTIGKEAWMVGFIGIATLGVSSILRHQFKVAYLATLIAGLSLAGVVRPHISALAVVSLVAATLWPTGSEGRRGRQIAALVVGAVLLFIAVGQVSDYFGADSVEFAPILDLALGRTAQGGSQFEPIRITGPLTLLPGTVSVLFRPFIFEADSALQIVGSVETLALALLTLASLNRIRRIPRLFLENGYVRFAAIYSFGFVVAFSVIANFGLLARQRTQLWPFFLLLLALSPHEGNDVNGRGHRLRQGVRRPTLVLNSRRSTSTPQSQQIAG